MLGRGAMVGRLMSPRRFYILIPVMVDMMTYHAHDYGQRDFGDVTGVCISFQDYITKNHHWMA